jgi:hypothetical protein
MLLRLAFICFVPSGSLLALRGRSVPFVEPPCRPMERLIEFSADICPLTPWSSNFADEPPSTEMGSNETWRRWK